MSTKREARTQGWMDKSVKDDIRRIWEWMKVRRQKFLVVLGWSLVFSIVTLKSYALLYETTPYLRHTPLIYTSVQDWTPRLVTIDYVVMIAVSVLAGALLMDLDAIVWGWLASLLLSFALSVAWVFFYVWYFLGLGETFSALGLVGQMLQWVEYFLMLNVFRMWFPVVPIMSLLSVFAGAFLRNMIRK